MATFQTLYLLSYPSLLLLFLFTSATPSPYSNLCNNIVPEQSPTNNILNNHTSLAFSIGYFTTNNKDHSFTNAKFKPLSIHKTLNAKTHNIKARLTLQTGIKNIPKRFDFYGFWFEPTGQVCMVSSTSDNARLVLSYSKELSIFGSLVKGVLESDGDKSLIVGVRKMSPLDYEFKFLDEAKSQCGENSVKSLEIESVLGGGLCNVLSRSHVFEVVYSNDCGSDCSPLRSDCGSDSSCGSLGSGVEYEKPSFMSLVSVLCVEERRMRMVLSFGDKSGFEPRSSLVVEGGWDVEKDRFCGVACRVMNVSEAVIGDCSLRLSLRLSGVLSLRSMGTVVGELWSVKNESDPSYFRKIEFSSLKFPLWRFLGVRYEYTESERVSKLCGVRTSSRKSKGKRYPDAQTSDMRFLMSVKDSVRGNVLRTAHAGPYFVGDRLCRELFVRGLGLGAGVSGTPMNVYNVTNSFTNITYRFHFLYPSSESRGDIYAEGTYDRDTGELCMVGCQSVNETKDCNLAIKLKFSPIDSKSDDRVKGTIESTREKTDPLYVGRMEILSRSIYVHQAKESVWRMDMEVVMVLISNTLSCLFVGMQLYHMKKHQEAVPFISITMVILLTLGHMIPLLLNFEELFKSNQQSLFFENDKWLETKEIVVRIVTMIAFLLECRLLQQAWTGRKTEDREGVWNAEKKVSYVCLPLYLTGGLIAWLVNRNRAPRRVVYVGKPRARNLLYRPVNLKRSFQRPPLWKDLKSYGGLMLDGFLLPQVLFNIFSHSDYSEALAVSFYCGNSVVRLLPHAYDLYRSHSYGKVLDWSFIYANHKMDYYSTAWDIVILCIGFVFAFFIFLQQRFGACCFIPKRFRDNMGYEKVVELQQTG